MSVDARPGIVVIASGSGTNLQALIDASTAGRLGAKIAAVFSDRSRARALDRARDAGIAAIHVPVERREHADYDATLREQVGLLDPNVIVLAGYMRIVSADFARAFAGRMINIHPSLLPLHKGLDTHRRALEAGDRVHGATVHFVTEELDDGPRIIQYRTTVEPEDSVDSLAARVLRGEHIILPRAVAWLAAARLQLIDDRVMLDGIHLDTPVIVEDDE